MKGNRGGQTATVTNVKVMKVMVLTVKNNMMMKVTVPNVMNTDA